MMDRKKLSLADMDGMVFFVCLFKLAFTVHSLVALCKLLGR